MPRIIDRTGQRQGRLLIVRRDFETPQTGTRARIRWWCQCDCGSPLKSISHDALGSMNQQSCGCLQRERASEANITHGATVGRQLAPGYSVWCSMKDRCFNPNNEQYRDYGGRGITICDRWMDFANFIADMGEPPEGLTIERIENNGNYEPGNCKWATRLEQNNNSRQCRRLTYNGVTATITEWNEILGFPKSSPAINIRLDRLGWSTEQALSTPLRVTKRKPRV